MPNVKHALVIENPDGIALSEPALQRRPRGIIRRVTDGTPTGPGSRRADDLRRAVEALPGLKKEFPKWRARERHHLAALTYLADEDLKRSYWAELPEGRLISASDARKMGRMSVVRVDYLAETIRKAQARKTSRLADPEPAKCLVCSRPADCLLSLEHNVGGVDANIGVCLDHGGVVGTDALLSHGVSVTYGTCSQMPTTGEIRSLTHGAHWMKWGIRACSSINGNAYGGLELDGTIVLADSEATIGEGSRAVMVAARVFLLAQGHTDLKAIDAALARVEPVLRRAFLMTPEEAALEPADPWLEAVGTNREFLAVAWPGAVEAGDPRPRSTSRRQRDAASGTCQRV
jgi:hypothetical protein